MKPYPYRADYEKKLALSFAAVGMSPHKNIVDAAMSFEDRLPHSKGWPPLISSIAAEFKVPENQLYFLAGIYLGVWVGRDAAQEVKKPGAPSPPS